MIEMEPVTDLESMREKICEFAKEKRVPFSECRTLLKNLPSVGLRALYDIVVSNVVEARKTRLFKECSTFRKRYPFFLCKLTNLFPHTF